MNFRALRLACRFLGVALLVLIVGCSQQPLTGDAAGALVRETNTVASSINDASNDIARLRRVHHVAELMHKPGPPKRRDTGELDNPQEPYERFGDFACEGIGAFGQQRAGIATLAQLNAVVAELLAASPDTLGALISSIDDHRGRLEGLKPVEAQTNLAKDCAAQLAKDLQTILTDREAYVAGLDPLTVIPVAEGVIVAAQTLWQAFEKLLIIVLQEVDAQARASQLKQFMEEPDTIAALEKALGGCVRSANSEAAKACLKKDSEKAPTIAELCSLRSQQRSVAPREKPPAGFVPLSDAALECILIERRTLGAVQPYVSYRGLRATIIAALDKPPTAERQTAFATLLRSVKTIDEELKLFDQLRTARIPPGQHAALVVGFVELRRIAIGDLTPAEKLKVMRANATRIAALLKATGQSFGDIKDKTGGLVDKLNELEKALRGRS